MDPGVIEEIAKADPPSSPEVHNLTSLSVLIPCRNEAQFIGACLDSVISNGYPHDRMEILVVDGMSEDATREVVRTYADTYPFVRLLENPRRITPCALNIGIAGARGDVVIRLDAHATYQPGYIERCVDALDRYGADGSGGIWNVVPRNDGIVSRAVIAVMTHRFGGAAQYRRAAGDEPQPVDLVPFFCCRRATLLRAGEFNEQLVRHQDFEYTVRLRRMGARFVLVPRAVCNYYARTDLRSFFVHSFRDGMWVILAAARSKVLPFSPRHLTPLVFVAALVAGSIAAPFSSLAADALAAVAIAYVVATAGAAAQIALRERTAGLFLVAPPVFAGRHLMFGLGSLVGLIRIAGTPQLWRRLLGNRRPCTAS